MDVFHRLFDSIIYLIRMEYFICIGDLFAKCPIEEFPGVAIEAVLDSSRYFVVRLKDDDGRTAFIGMGFADRY